MVGVASSERMAMLNCVQRLVVTVAADADVTVTNRNRIEFRSRPFLRDMTFPP